MTTLPTWAVWLVALGSPALSFIGVAWAQIIAKGTRDQLETRSNREETMRTLRWAAELGVSTDAAKARLGVAQLKALADSDMLDASQQLFIDAALQAVVKPSVQELESAGPATDVVRMSTTASLSGEGTLTASGVASIPEAPEEGEDG